MDCCCKGCGDRYVGCHSKCETYLSWLAEVKEINRQKYVYLQNTDYRDETRVKKSFWRMRKSGDWETKNKYKLYDKGRR